MTQKKCRLFTAEQKAAEAPRIVEQADQSINQIVKELGIGVSTIHTWMRQARIDRQGDSKGPLTSSECQELVALCCDL